MSLEDVSTLQGRTFATKHPAYVFSINANAGLMHKIANVELHWYTPRGNGVVTRKARPKMIAHTVCGMNFFLRPEKTRTCEVPNPDAILCGRCHGEVPSFSKKHGGKHANTNRAEAHVKLGCIVKGY